MQSRVIASFAARRSRALLGSSAGRLPSMVKPSTAVWAPNHEEGMLYAAAASPVSGRNFVTSTQTSWMPVKTIEVRLMWGCWVKKLL